MKYKCIVLYFFIVNETHFLLTLVFCFCFTLTNLFHSFFLKVSKPFPWPPKENWTKFEKGETSRSPIPDTPTPTIPSPINSLEVPKHCFENHTAFGRWIDTFKHRSLSYIDILDYNIFLFEDFEIISSLIQSTPGKLLDPGSTSYPILVKIFYCNLSFIVIDGSPALRSFVKGQEIVIFKTLVNDLLKFSNSPWFLFWLLFYQTTDPQCLESVW